MEKKKKQEYSPLVPPAFVQPSLPVNQEEQHFYHVPTSTASNLVMEVLGAGEDVAELPTRKGKVSRSSSITVKQSGDKRLVTLNSEKPPVKLVRIELADIDRITGSLKSKSTKKLFVYALTKANEQCFIPNGELSQNFVSFPLQKLVDIGFYKTLSGARRGFNTGMDALTSIKISGKEQRGKNGKFLYSSIDDSDAIEVLFTGARIEKGQCYIFLNERINWGFLAQYFTLLPDYYFSISNRGSDLLYYIFYLARQNTKDIKERGYFTISFRAIQQRLYLPSEVGNTRPQQTIKEPIEAAIEEIEENHHAMYGNNMEFTLLPVCDDTASIADYLDNGYLKIFFKGAFADYFIAICESKASRIEAAQKRHDKIVDQAKAINLAEKMKEGEEGGASK